MMENKCKSVLFNKYPQFHFGAINRIFYVSKGILKQTFQFHYGAINSTPW